MRGRRAAASCPFATFTRNLPCPPPPPTNRALLARCTEVRRAPPSGTRNTRCTCLQKRSARRRCCSGKHSSHHAMGEVCWQAQSGFQTKPSSTHWGLPSGASSCTLHHYSVRSPAAGLWRGTEVAIKSMILPARMSGAEKREKMAIMEAAISSAMHHPNIVQVRRHMHPVGRAARWGHTVVPPTGHFVSLHAWLHGGVHHSTLHAKPS